MAKFLYADFLENKRAYNLAQGSWKRLLNSLLKTHGYTYTPYINQMQNGKKEYDGNPIFSAFIPESNAPSVLFRFLPMKKGRNISAWIDDIEMNGQSKNQKTKELVLDIKLSKQAKTIAKDLMGKWIVGCLDDAALDVVLKSEVH